ncbi:MULTISPECIES: hypothetical protein [Streptomyces]|uniref:Lipoprotein n=1 Tax=Streptomyces ardesiacus TaxID=285564 RepID=A0ABW8H4F4_9ACTN|nr:MULTISPECIES: hypothetical protein [Streptomyces]MCL7365249.1 hypothetical protein [Streptomyces ardesiacus]NEB60721.1 hypothetical protein [Streptomyces diastaticus]
MSVTPRRRIRRAAWLGAVCALAVTGAGLTGCGSEDPDAGTNGLGKLPADKIHAKAATAAEAAGTVRLHGTVEAGGNTYTLDMRLKADGGTGSVAAQGTTFGLLRVGEQLFLKADATFWSHGDGDAKAADKLAGKYVKVPQSDPVYKKFSGFTDKDVLLDGLLTLHGTVKTDGRHEQAGVRTIRITGDEGAGGSLDVSLEGTPYPLRLVRAGSAGTIGFSDWNKDFALEQPAKDDTLDYGGQLPTS